jgi:riboflavin kinase / FMN adenylyltransferase
MEIIRGIHNIRARHKGCVATIGNFDGVHLGHEALLARLNAWRAEYGLASLLITFEPQPREFFRGASMPARLTRFREKVTLLSRTGIDRVLCLPFNERLANTPARTVIDRLLVDRLGVRHLVIGDDFRFGRGAEGDFAMLAQAGAEHGFDVNTMPTLEVAGERVSSTRVRELLAAGDFERAEQLLNHRYFIMGRVVYGRQLGRSLGVPTANIQLQRYRAALEGVYAVEVSGLEGEHRGVANVGVRPTVDGKEPLLEVHLFDFDQNIYGRLLTVTFRRKLRDELRFGSLTDLQAQILRDIDTARAWFRREGREDGNA